MDQQARRGDPGNRREISQSWASAGPEAAEKAGEALDYFGIAGFDGAFVAWQAEPEGSMRDQMALLTEAMVAIAERVLAGR
ncbi:hypothetical protein [Amycolatopsis circi]|uniref:hypothetical protein n=1 Tax=Amycolatopsis circi TaxID=871959 RepID=UPI001FC9A23F|nr:hypothetical protein [Amycolatopsis circi]